MLGHSNSILTINIVTVGHKDIGRSAMGISNYEPENPFKPDSHKSKVSGGGKRQRLMDTEGCDEHECELNE